MPPPPGKAQTKQKLTVLPRMRLANLRVPTTKYLTRDVQLQNSKVALTAWHSHAFPKLMRSMRGSAPRSKLCMHSALHVCVGCA